MYSCIKCYYRSSTTLDSCIDTELMYRTLLWIEHNTGLISNAAIDQVQHWTHVLNTAIDWVQHWTRVSNATMDWVQHWTCVSNTSIDQVQRYNTGLVYWTLILIEYNTGLVYRTLLSINYKSCRSHGSNATINNYWAHEMLDSWLEQYYTSSTTNAALMILGYMQLWTRGSIEYIHENSDTSVNR